MTIEDIQYLQAHSKKEDFVMFIDSSTRDRNVHPHPNSYSITFDEPFKNVYGVDILDMLIPRTMYNIDTCNNGLCIGIGAAMMDRDTYTEVVIQAQDYTIDDLYVGLNNTIRDFAAITVKPLTPSNPIQGGKYVYESFVPFAFDLRRSTIRESIGFDETASVEFASCYTVIGADLVASLRVEKSKTVVSFGDADPEASVLLLNGGIQYAQSFVVGSECDLSAVELAPGLELATVAIVQADALPSPNFVVPFMPLSHYTNLDSDVTRMVRLVAGRNYFIIVKCTTMPVLYFNPVGPAEPDTTNNVLQCDNGAWTQSAVRGFLVAVRASNNVFRINTPGLISLVGERSILLRIPEIEQHINSSYIYGKNSPGMALIKLGVRGYQQVRFDFTSIKHREFVPIAKLTRLSFKFDRVSGPLYDFKGVNHIMLILVKYLVPYSSDLAENYKPILNPNYKPDVLLYLRENQRVVDELEDRQNVGRRFNEIEQYYEERYADLPSVGGSDDEEDV